MLQDTLLAMKEQINRNNGAEQRVANIKDKTNGLISLNNELRTRVKLLEQNAQRKEDLAIEWTSKIQELEGEMGRLEEDNSKLTRERELVKSSLSGLIKLALEARDEDFEADIVLTESQSSLLPLVHNLKASIEELTEQIDELRLRNDQLLHTEALAQQLHRDLTQASKQTDQLTLEVDRLRLIIDATEAAQEPEIQKLVSQSQHYKDLYEKTKANMQESIESSQSMQISLTTANQELTAALTNAENELAMIGQRWDKEKDKYEGEIHRLEKRLKAEKTKRIDLEEKLARIEEELDLVSERENRRPHAKVTFQQPFPTQALTELKQNNFKPIRVKTEPDKTSSPSQSPPQFRTGGSHLSPFTSINSKSPLSKNKTGYRMEQSTASPSPHPQERDHHSHIPPVTTAFEQDDSCTATMSRINDVH